MRYLTIAIAVLLYCPALRAQTKPMIFHGSESVRPGQVISLQGTGFGKHPKLGIMMVKEGVKPLHPEQELIPTQSSDQFIAAILPPTAEAGIYAVWVKNGNEKSASHYINRPRIYALPFNEIMPGGMLRLYGRNLRIENGVSHAQFIFPGTKPIEAKVLKAEAFEVLLQVPENLVTGKNYRLQLNNGGGWVNADDSLYVRTKEEIPFNVDAAWCAGLRFTKNIYNVKTDKRLSHRATGDGRTNDRAAIQEAIDKAAANGGGVVLLPAGNYKLDYRSGCGLTMRSNVLLQGDNRATTTISYGYGQPFSTERVKAAYGWTLGWPDSRLEGMGMVFPGGITQSGLINLSLKNVNESGAFVHTIKNMPEGGSRIILLNCDFDFSNGWGLAMVNIDNLLITGCTFNSTAMDVRGINAPTRTWPWDLKNSTHVVFSNNKTYYYAGRFGANGCQQTVFTNNLFVRNGDHQSKGETGGLSLDYVKNVVVQANEFEVTGKAVAVRNQGETILSQGGMSHQQTMGKVTTATATTITDAKNEYQDFTDRVSTDWQYVIHPTNYQIAIVSGKGAGQCRIITSNTDTSITVARAWDIIPEPGSRYVVTQWSAQQMLVIDNVLKDNNRGIWIYSGGNDIVIAGNKLINSEGIYIRSDQRAFSNRYNLAWNISITDNEVQNTNGIRPAYIAAYLAQVKADKLFGTGILGLEVRNNTIQAHTPNVKNGWVKGEGYFNYVYDEEAKGASRDAGTPGILGTVFEANKCTNAECNYTYGQGAHLTVFRDTLPNYSQEAAEANALLKYEAANPPQAVWPMPAAHKHPDSLGIYLQRSAALLHNSTPQKRLPVHVVIYGQSITGSQLFTQYINEYLQAKYPFADLNIQNLCIGGFAASQIVRTAPHDVYHSRADLIIFHVYGGERTGELDTLFTNLRLTTTADIILMNHHLNANQKKFSEATANGLRAIAGKYHCELVDVSNEWMQYLQTNNLQPKDLLRDNVHPNRQGNWLLAQLVGRHIIYQPSERSLSGKLVQTITPAKKQTYKIQFNGTRLDAVASAATLKKQGPANAQLLLDGKPVTADPVRFGITRPSAGAGTWWPAVRRVTHRNELVPEDWVLEVTGVNADTTVYTFRITGSVTGEDGNGASNALFVSRSGRVVIEPADILFNKIKETFKTTTPVGFKVYWSVAPVFAAEYQAPLVMDENKLYKTTLVNGLQNGKHTVELVSKEKNGLPIDYFEAHQPQWPVQ